MPKCDGFLLWRNHYESSNTKIIAFSMFDQIEGIQQMKDALEKLLATSWKFLFKQTYRSTIKVVEKNESYFDDYNLQG
jgi:hypothetical protein